MISFIEVTYTGREKNSNRVFDTNDEKIAKKEEVYNKDTSYKPMLMVLGKDKIISGLEEALLKMKVGESKKIEIPPEKAYGKRDPNLVKVVPLKVFMKNEINPYPGMVLNLDNMMARVQTVSGGRVRVDFNHELAGKVLLFNVKIEKELTGQDDRIRALFVRIFVPVKSEDLRIKKESDELELTLPKDVLKLKDLQTKKIQFINEIKQFLGVKKVKVSEEY